LAGGSGLRDIFVKVPVEILFEEFSLPAAGYEEVQAGSVMRKTVIVRYGELALKSKRVRRRFEQRLCENIELTLDGVDYKLKKLHGRIFIDTKAPREIEKRLVLVPGVVSVSSATKTEATLEAVRSVAVREAKKLLSPGSSFAVLTRRIGKHPFSSQDINEEVGAAILDAVPRSKVNLSTPDYRIFIEIRGDDSYIFSEILGGIGGLPVGSQGKVVTLFSGGINSFLATCLMLKRGCLVFPLFFDEGSDGRLRGRVISAAKEFLAFHPKLELRVLPFRGVRDVFGSGVSRGLFNVLCARARLRAAQVIGEGLEVDAVVTGETAEQGSGILHGFQVIEEACELPVLRPLVGLDKRRIDQIARRTEELGVFLPPKSLSRRRRHLKTDVNLKKVRELEHEFKIDVLVRSLLKEVEVVELR